MAPDRPHAGGATLLRRLRAAVVAACVAVLAISAQAAADDDPPSQLYGRLFEDVQLQRVFPDGKTFADAVPNAPPAVVVRRYEEQRARPGFDLAAFVARNFTVSRPAATGYRSIPGQDVCSHVESLWPVLTRQPGKVPPHSSLLPLPEPYVVPGGRFDEIYYWDSYFTMLGLEQSGRGDLALDMARNLASLALRFGHVPNGNRTYYLSRSQPPFLAAMVELVAEASADPDAVRAEFLPALAAEHAFWVDGEATLAPGEAHRRVVRLADGTLLNRYWDDRAAPRDESYREDVATASAASGRPAAEVYRHLRAAAESGWDFSSRWLGDGRTLATIRTTDLVPVDLNSALFRLETTLATAYRSAGAPERAAGFEERAARRETAVRRHLWDEASGAFVDYLWRQDRRHGAVTAATVAPLFFGLATPAQAERVAGTVRATLLRPGGVVTTTATTGQQWDAPNGWAPLQWMAIEGFSAYGESELARTIARRWMAKVIAAYRATGKLVEKYDVDSAAVATGGGEYPTQDGFGWTNGVLRRLLALYPQAVAPRSGEVWCGGAAANDNMPAGAVPEVRQRARGAP